jgi:nucleoside-diphosphate-sugar epimerase
VSRVVVVTGANGFLGRAVCAELTRVGHTVRALVRSPGSSGGFEPYPYAGLDDVAALRHACRGADACIHLAARVHQMRGTPEQDAEYQRINTIGTQAFAMIAAEESVGDFLFASSVKAVGEANDTAWTEREAPSPKDPYGVSKLHAERALGDVTALTGMSTAALRLPLMYGAGMKANMLRLFELVDRRVPLPLGGIRNRRSMLYVENAAAAFCRLIGAVKGHELFFASDGEDVSTPDLVVRIAAALGREPRLIPIPHGMLQVIARLELPKISPIAQRIGGSLQVDSSSLRARIGPLPYSLDEGLQRTARWFRESSINPT